MNIPYEALEFLMPPRPVARFLDKTMHSGRIVQGDQSFLVDFRPVARIDDMHLCPESTPFCPHIGGAIIGPCQQKNLGRAKPLALKYDLCFCIGPPDIITSASETTVTRRK